MSTCLQGPLPLVIEGVAGIRAPAINGVYWPQAARHNGCLAWIREGNHEVQIVRGKDDRWMIRESIALDEDSGLGLSTEVGLLHPAKVAKWSAGEGVDADMAKLLMAQMVRHYSFT